MSALRILAVTLLAVVSNGCTRQVEDGPVVGLPVEGVYTVTFNEPEPDCEAGTYLPAALERPEYLGEGFDMLVFHPEGRFHFSWGVWTTGGAIHCPADEGGGFVCPQHFMWDDTPRDGIFDNTWRLVYQFEGTIDESRESLTASAAVEATCYGSGCEDTASRFNTCTFQLVIEATLLQAEPFEDPRDYVAEER